MKRHINQKDIESYSPFRKNYLELPDGLRMHYVDEGKGEQILLLHGNPTWSYFFREPIRKLRDNYRLIAPDHIGCGLSDKPDNATGYPFLLSRRISDIEYLLDKIAPEGSLTLVLHDWGGAIGMGLAARRPERIARIIVMNTAAFRLPEKKKFPWQLHLFRNTPIGPFLVENLNLFSIGATRFCCTNASMSKEVRKAYIAPYRGKKNRLAVMRFIHDIPLNPEHESFSALEEIENSLEKFRDLPFLILWGEKDFVFDRHFRMEWERRFPLAQKHVFENSGHYLLEDSPEEVTELISSFLKTKPEAGKDSYSTE